MMKHTMPSLDKRLETVMELFPACDVGADIGADHGLLSCEILAKEKAKRMIVTDISASSLSKAEKLIKTHDLEARATFIQGDGLTVLAETVQSVAICGMGGKVIASILKKGKACLNGAAIVMCPQTDIDILRRAIYEIGYHIDEERIAVSVGRLYVVIRAVSGPEALSEKEAFLGPVLMTKRDEDTLSYYQWRKNVERIVRLPDQEKKIEWLEELLEC